MGHLCKVGSGECLTVHARRTDSSMLEVPVAKTAQKDCNLHLVFDAADPAEVFGSVVEVLEVSWNAGIWYLEYDAEAEDIHQSHSETGVATRAYPRKPYQVETLLK